MEFPPGTEHACVHETRTHLSRYLEEMRRGDFDRLVICRYTRPVAILMVPESLRRSAREHERRERAAFAARVREQRRIARARMLSAPAHQKCGPTQAT